MRRTIFLGLFAALLLAPAAARAASSTQVLRDCYDDGVLQGSYSPSDLRKAYNQLPTDVDEYSDCRDVLSRAIAKGTSSSGGSKSQNGGGASGSGGASNDSGGAGTTSGGGGGGHPSAQPGATVDPDVTVAPATPADQAAIDKARQGGGTPVELGGRPVAPGRLAASVGRNSLPTTLVAALVLLATAALIGAAPSVLRLARRRRS